MGLDNGIRLVVPENHKYPFYVRLRFGTDLCYWRKCWDMRNDILDILIPEGEEDDAFSYNLTPEQVDKIIKVIWHRNNRKHWTDDFWDYDHYVWWIQIQHIINLLWLKRYLKRYPKEQAIFYDSY